MGVGSKNPLFGYDLVPLASYVINFKSLGPKLWKFFPDIDQIGPVKYKSIDEAKWPLSDLKHCERPKVRIFQCCYFLNHKLTFGDSTFELPDT